MNVWTDSTMVELTDTDEFCEAGFNLPLFCTAQVQHLLIRWTRRDNRRQTYQDTTGRRWDILWMLSQALRTRQAKVRAGTVQPLKSGDMLPFTVYAIPRDGYSEEPQEISLMCRCSTADGIPTLIITEPHDVPAYLKPALQAA